LLKNRSRTVGNEFGRCGKIAIYEKKKKGKSLERGKGLKARDCRVQAWRVPWEKGKKSLIGEDDLESVRDAPLEVGPVSGPNQKHSPREKQSVKKKYKNIKGKGQLLDL